MCKAICPKSNFRYIYINRN